MTTRIALVPILIVATTVTAKAELTAEDFFSMYDAGGQRMQEFLLGHISGAAAGFGYANAALESTGQSLLYCQPRKISLSGETALGIARDYYQNNAKMKTAPIPLVLLLALQASFPCP